MERKKVYIHESAFVSDDAKIGENTKVWVNCQIREGTSIGQNCILSKDTYIDLDVQIGNNVKIQNGVSIYHGVTIEDDVFIGPNVAFTNDMFPRALNDDWKVTETLIKKGASIGANSTIRCGNTLGEYCMIGAGSVVTKDVASFELVAGNPAKRIGYVCKCGYRLGAKCPTCGIDIKEIRK